MLRLQSEQVRKTEAVRESNCSDFIDFCSPTARRIILDSTDVLSSSLLLPVRAETVALVPELLEAVWIARVTFKLLRCLLRTGIL